MTPKNEYVWNGRNVSAREYWRHAWMAKASTVVLTEIADAFLAHIEFDQTETLHLHVKRQLIEQIERDHGSVTAPAARNALLELVSYDLAEVQRHLRNPYVDTELMIAARTKQSEFEEFCAECVRIRASENANEEGQRC